MTEENANLKELISKYSEGPEINSDGIIGPSSLTKNHPILIKKLRSAEQGQFLKPFKIENWWLIVRLESFDPASVDGFIVENKNYELLKPFSLNHPIFELRLGAFTNLERFMLENNFKIDSFDKQDKIILAVRNEI